MGQAGTDQIGVISILRVRGLREFALLADNATFTHRAQAREMCPKSLSHFTAPVIPNS